eukprot:g24801.t1
MKRILWKGLPKPSFAIWLETRVLELSFRPSLQQLRWLCKQDKSHQAAQAFRGKYSVEGTLLPNADSEVPEDDAALSIDSRLGNRAQAKPSSKRLEQESSAGPGMSLLCSLCLCLCFQSW